MSTNAQRRRAKRDAEHIPGYRARVNLGANREARRASGPRPKPIKPLTERQRRYRRAAEDRLVAEARAKPS